MSVNTLGQFTTYVPTTATEIAGSVKANQLKVSADQLVDLNTQVNNADITLKNGGDININEKDNINLSQLSTPNGNINVKANGAIAVDKVTATAQVKLASLNADIKRLASSQADKNIVSQDLSLVSATGIGLSTLPLSIQTSTLSAAATSGDIYLTQQGNLNLKNLTTPANVQLTIKNGGLTGSATGTLKASQANANGNINVISGGNINMLTNNTQSDGVRTTTGSGVITYQAADTLNLGYLQSTEFGGGVKITAAKINDGITTGGNIEGSFIDIKSPSMNPTLVEQLIAEKILESALIKLNYQVVGGSLSNSRKFMSDLFVSQQQLSNSLKFDPTVGLKELVNIDLLK
ncbi:hypothetical protein [Acinetobacter kyonggiensis]|uniref:Filamentous hemagglutinin n=1 Tax=Acinetobacter kyonggiensis TaxID=595670 RepID=A0A1H3ND46_9GAMM|nr:hypothetical protein [Acinetobacter kyonggiensis]SDY86119.1 hypothetical protein SAMN05421643_14113 [Acinetobacter kyonggiensis]